MTSELLVALAALLLEDKNLVRPACVINDRCLYYSALYVWSTDLHIAIFIDQKHFVKRHLGILGCLETVDEDFHSGLNFKLRACNINNYLVENVTYDPVTSDKVKEDILNSIPLANGMVQAGERIVDRGEIVDNHTYNVLRSLKIVHETKSGGAPRQSIILSGQFVLVFGILFCL